MNILEHSSGNIRELIRSSLEKHLVPGLAMAIIRGGKIDTILTEGYADPERKIPVTEHTHFEAASLTKPVFAKLIHKLVSEGRLDPDVPISRCFPGPFPSEDPRAAKITPRHVLCHAAGLPDWGDTPVLLFEPGEGFGYSGKGYTYLQEMVEALTGRRLDELFQAEIFTPLAMEDAAMIWTAPLNHTLARTVDENGDIEPPRNSCLRSVALEPNAAFSLYTTILDYPQFLLSVMEDTSFLRMVTSVRNPAPHHVFWGLGLGMYRDLLWHWGDNGGFKSLVLMDPEAKDALLIMTNGYNGLEVCFDAASHLTDMDLSEIQQMIAEAE